MSLSTPSPSPPNPRSPQEGSNPPMSDGASPREGARPASAGESSLPPLLASAALIVILGVQIVLPMGAVAPEPPGLAPRRARPISLPPPVDARAILSSPIFAPDRRPGATGEGAGAGATPMGGYAAVGAAAGRTVSTAVITLPNGQAQLMHRGDSVDGWRLVGVEPSRLIFERQGERHVLVVGAPAAPVGPVADPSAGPAAAQ